MKSIQWYANHPTLGEIQISAENRVALILGRRVTLFSPRMCRERLTAKGDELTIQCLELSLGDLGNHGVIDPAIRAECSFQLKIPDLEAALLLAAQEFDSEVRDPLLKFIDERLEKWIVQAWDRAMFSSNPDP